MSVKDRFWWKWDNCNISGLNSVVIHGCAVIVSGGGAFFVDNASNVFILIEN